MHIPVSHGRLEAHLREAEGAERGTAVVCHPHPLYGGTMHTKAVFRAAQALADVGFHVLRFNFRGVGTSTGSYANGIGEREDAVAALDWIHERHPSLPVLVGGFSFGSMVALRVGVDDPRPRALLGMGLAIKNWEHSFLGDIRRPTLIVQGENDEFGSGQEVARVLAAVGGDQITLRRIPGSGHFFHGHFEALQREIHEYFTDGPGAAPFGRGEPAP